MEFLNEDKRSWKDLILVKRLRGTVTQQDTEGEKYELPYNPDGPQAADHIEELEAKLAKAVEALERVSNSQPRPKRNGDYDRSDVSALQRIARTALAELTGAQKDGN